MKKLFTYIVLSLFIISLSISSSFAAGRDYIYNKVNSIISESSLDGAQMGIYIEHLKSGEVIYDYNSSYPLIPASNMKILVTSTSISTLGHDFCFDTNLYGKEIENGVLKSDLIFLQQW